MPNNPIDWNWVGEELSRSEGISRRKKLLSACLNKSLLTAKPLAMPAMTSIKKKVLDIWPRAIEIEGRVKFVFSAAVIPSYIKDATEVCIFLVTIGGDIEKKASSLMAEGDFLGGYIMDRIGSFAVESLARGMEEILRGTCKKKNSSVSARFSPGYCDWPLKEQYKIAKILDFGKAGVTLTKACMMVPKKSISAMAAIGPKGVFSKRLPQCLICGKKECDYRRDT